MFEIIIVILALSGEPAGKIIPPLTFSTEASCYAAIPAALEEWNKKMTQMAPGVFKIKEGRCVIVR